MRQPTLFFSIAFFWRTWRPLKNFLFFHAPGMPGMGGKGRRPYSRRMKKKGKPAAFSGVCQASTYAAPQHSENAI